MQRFVLNRELHTPAKHRGAERTLGMWVVENGEIATELIGVIRAVHA